MLLKTNWKSLLVYFENSHQLDIILQIASRLISYEAPIGTLREEGSCSRVILSRERSGYMGRLASLDFLRPQEAPFGGLSSQYSLSVVQSPPPFSQLVLTDEIWTLLPLTARLAVYIPLLCTSHPTPAHNRIDGNKLDRPRGTSVNPESFLLSL